MCIRDRYMIISRGDSTLRGHYPLETELLCKGFEADRTRHVDGEIICPFFKEGGRFTIGNIHYVKNENLLVPAGQTEFAKDKTFGYTSSNLCEYIEEKTEGKYLADEVTCISLEELREAKIDEITEKLLKVEKFGKVVVNAVDYCDLKVFVIALYKAMEQGKNFMFRVAAAIVKVIGGISDQPLLTRKMCIRDRYYTRINRISRERSRKSTSRGHRNFIISGSQYIGRRKSSRICNSSSSSSFDRNVYGSNKCRSRCSFKYLLFSRRSS